MTTKEIETGWKKERERKRQRNAKKYYRLKYYWLNFIQTFF